LIFDQVRRSGRGRKGKVWSQVSGAIRETEVPTIRGQDTAKAAVIGLDTK
jgi:hypothetical protein